MSALKRRTTRGVGTARAVRREDLATYDCTCRAVRREELATYGCTCRAVRREEV